MSVSLSNREAEIMAVLWEQGACTVAEVKEKLSDPLAYTTVLTILRNLEAKEYVGHEPDGRAHRYFARVRQQAARKSAIRHLAGLYDRYALQRPALLLDWAAGGGEAEWQAELWRRLRERLGTPHPAELLKHAS